MAFKKSERTVIVGGSHAGLAVIEALCRQGYSGTVTLVSEEPVPVFSPTALPYLLGKDDKSSRTIRPINDYRSVKVVQERAESIDTRKLRVYLRSGGNVHYDRLVLAMGASAARLPIDGPKRGPLLTLRRIEDLRRIERKAKSSSKVLIIGAGLVGLHLAKVFSRMGKKTHVVELTRQVLPALVCPELADLLKNDFEEKGVRISLNARITELTDEGALLSHGERTTYDLAICAIGINPNLGPIQETSIAVGKGVLVNEHMETNIPGIYACGDLAEFRDFFTGESRLDPTVINAAQQGKVVAENIVGKNSAHPGLISINIFNCLGPTLFSIGRTTPEKGDTMVEAYDIEKDFFKRIIFHNGALKGAILYNCPVDGGTWYRLIRERSPLIGYEEGLLSDPLLWGKRIAERVFKD